MVKLKNQVWVTIYGKKRGNHLLLWEEVKIIDKEEHWRIRHLKEAAHMLGYSGLLS